MADIAGRSALAAISSDGGNNYVAIGGLKEISITVNGETIDVTDHDSGLYKEFIGGRLELTLSMSGNYDEADAGQEAVWTAHLARTKIKLRFRPSTGGGNKEYVADAIITSIEDSAPNDDAAAVSIEAQISGSLTRQNQ